MSDPGLGDSRHLLKERDGAILVVHCCTGVECGTLGGRAEVVRRIVSMAKEEFCPTPTTYRDLIRQQVATEPIVKESVGNLPAAVVAGSLTALLAAVLWAALTVATGYNYGIVAAGVGLVVGIAVRIAGRGSEPVFSFVGATLSSLGCALGNLLAACAYIADLKGMALMDVVGQLSPSVAWTIMSAAASPVDVILFGVAAYEGYKISVN